MDLIEKIVDGKFQYIFQGKIILKIQKSPLNPQKF